MQNKVTTLEAMVIITIMLTINIGFGNSQSSCSCYAPPNYNVTCNTNGCSIGDNSSCGNGNRPIVYNAFYLGSLVNGIGAGCNCPGNPYYPFPSYPGGAYPYNGYYNGRFFNYNTCDNFGNNTTVDPGNAADVTACCNLCCSLPVGGD